MFENGPHAENIFVSFHLSCVNWVNMMHSELRIDAGAQYWVLTETILPSVGMYAGRLLSRSRVCSVLNVASSFAFSSTFGGLWARQ